MSESVEDPPPSVSVTLSRILLASGLNNAEACALLNEYRVATAQVIEEDLNGTFYRDNPFPKWRFVAREAWYAGVNASIFTVTKKEMFWTRLVYSMRKPRRTKRG